MRASLFLYLRLLFAWGFVFFATVILFANTRRGPPAELVFVGLALLVIVVLMVSTHLRRVKLMVDRLDSTSLATWHRRQIEMPVPAGESFEMIDAAIRELPRVDAVESTRDSLQIRAVVLRDASAGSALPLIGRWFGRGRNQVTATVTPREATSSIALVCEPEGRVWRDWFLLDDGSNLANANALTRALSRRIDERRRIEAIAVRSNSNEKALAVARLGLLQAQVEPHFLYNTLGSAKYLIKSDPAKAEAMIDNLIGYLRRSLPRAEDSLSTLGEEVARARGYLDILQFRMGTRLVAHVDVPEALQATPLPTMIVQMLVENAIKHGLEPKSGGGNIWLLARRQGEQVAITVADDGLGLAPATAGGDAQRAATQGTGIGLDNIRERLKLAFGDAAQFTLVSNFPSGVAATVTVPAPPATAATGDVPVVRL